VLLLFEVLTLGKYSRRLQIPGGVAFRVSYPDIKDAQPSPLPKPVYSLVTAILIGFGVWRVCGICPLIRSRRNVLEVDRFLI
jgi:hypothetical protein